MRLFFASARIMKRLALCLHLHGARIYFFIIARGIINTANLVRVAPYLLFVDLKALSFWSAELGSSRVRGLARSENYIMARSEIIIIVWDVRDCKSMPLLELSKSPWGTCRFQYYARAICSYIKRATAGHFGIVIYSKWASEQRARIYGWP